MKTILVDAVDTFVIEWEWIFQEMHDLLESYENPKIVLTNANDEQVKIFGMENLPYPLFTMKHNPDKPDPLYFETFLKEHNLWVNEVIYFEHAIDACKSAESLWIITYHYDMDIRDLVSLKKFLDSNL